MCLATVLTILHHETGHAIIPGFFPVRDRGCSCSDRRANVTHAEKLYRILTASERRPHQTFHPLCRHASRRSGAFIDHDRRGRGRAGGSGPFKNLKGRAGNGALLPSICSARSHYPQSTSVVLCAVSRTGSKMKRSRQHAVGCAISGRSRERMT